MTNEVTRTAPKRIWLCVSDEEGHNVGYVREDVAEAERDALRALLLEAENIRTDAPGFVRAFSEWSAKRDAALAQGEKEPHPDDAAVDMLASAMKNKLAKKRADGYGGWNDNNSCTPAFLRALLRSHITKGDPVDVANFCAFLFARGEPTAEKTTRIDAAFAQGEKK